MLHNPPVYDMDIQALIPPALAVLHNFIQQYDPEDIEMSDDNDNDDDNNNDNDDKLPNFQSPLFDTIGELEMGAVMSYENSPS